MVALHARERARDRELGRGPQHREQLHFAVHLGERGAQQPLDGEALAELVVDLDAVPRHVARDAERSLAIATASNPERSGEQATHETIAVTGRGR